MKTTVSSLPENVIQIDVPKTYKHAEAIAAGRFKIIPFTNRNGTQSWRVTGSKRDGERVRENFKNEKAARCRHLELETEFLGSHSETTIRATKLSTEQLQLAEVAFIKLGDDWLRILDAVEEWKQRGKSRVAVESPRLDVAVKKFEEWMDSALCNLAPTTKQKYRHRVCDVFVNAVPNRPVSDFTPDDIEETLSKRTTSAADRDTAKRAISSFFSWCIDRPRRWATTNPCREVKIALPEDSGPPVVLTVKDCERLLRATVRYKRGLLAPYVALCLFGGLRPDSEAPGLQWGKVNFADGEIVIEAHTSKNRRRRVIEIIPTLRAWLKRYEKKTIFPANWRKHFAEIKSKAGFGTPTADKPNLKPWTADVMRHTAISHFFRDCESYGKTAEYFDNSEGIIKRHYQGRVSSTDTKAFYKLTPEAITKGTK